MVRAWNVWPMTTMDRTAWIGNERRMHLHHHQRPSKHSSDVVRCGHGGHRTVTAAACTAATTNNIQWIIVFIVLISLSNTNTASTKVMQMTQSNNHANISELLDNLLRGYDNSIRPGFGGKYTCFEFSSPLDFCFFFSFLYAECVFLYYSLYHFVQIMKYASHTDSISGNYDQQFPASFVKLRLTRCSQQTLCHIRKLHTMKFLCLTSEFVVCCNTHLFWYAFWAY